MTDLTTRAECLARDYKIDVEHIERALEACSRAGVRHNYYIKRYLENDKLVPLDLDVDEAMRDLNIEKRDKEWLAHVS